MNEQMDKQKLNQLINFSIDKTLNKEYCDFFKENYEDKGVDIEFEKSVLRSVLEKTIEKYSNDYSSETYYKIIDYVNNQRDYFTDVLESEVYDEFIEELKIHPTIDDQWVEFLEDIYIGDGFLMNLLHYFRLFYEKWYIEVEIKKSMDELA